MTEKVQAKKQHLVLALLFSLLFFVPLFLSPFFPESNILQAINQNGIAILILAILAGSISGLVTWIMFRGRSG
jgi:hypothetical protein